MAPLCFIPAISTLHTSFTGLRPSSTTPLTPSSITTSRTTIRCALPLVPGVPPGEDARENAPLSDYVPRPVETYDNRGFAKVLPRTWAGATETIGVASMPTLPEDRERARIIQVDNEATGAFVRFAQMVKDDREKELAELKARNATPMTGRATCGEEEGKEFVSNYRTVLVDGVKSVEYWGAPNGPVPKLFGV